MNEARWTIEELGEQVAAALASGGYEGVASGRVRDVPDPRTIRYYATLGLVDRPSGFRGRTALYGPRHVRQLVALKRLQAEGLSLAEAQRRLAGADDAALAAAVGGEAPPPARAAPPPGRTTERSRNFWKSAPSAPPPETPAAVVPMQAVRVGDDLTLLLAAARPLDADDLRVVRLAAAPLLELLRLRGLLGATRGQDEAQGRGESTDDEEDAP